MPDVRYCAGNRRDGTPCTATVTAPQTFCWWHDPANAAQRSAAASKAAKSKGPDGELAALKARLKELLELVVEGKLEKGRGAVAASLSGVIIKICEEQRKQEEHRAMLHELEELRELVARNRAGSQSRWTS